MDEHRRIDDPNPAVTAQAADAFFAGLPQAIAELEEGRRQNRETAQAARSLAKILRGAVLFVFAVGILGGWILDHQQGQLDDAATKDRRDAQVTCRAVNANATSLNRFVDALVRSVQTNKAYTPAEKQMRIDSFESIRQRVPACDPPKEKP